MKNEKIFESLTYEGNKLVFNNIYNKYPSSIFQRKPFLSLNGRYKLEVNKSKLIPSIYSSDIWVPFAVESLLSQHHEPAKSGCVYHYHRDFEYPVKNENEDVNFTRSNIYVNIVRVIGDFTIYVNGKEIYTGKDEFNVKAKIDAGLVSGINQLDISLVPTHSDFNGIVGNVFLDSADDGYIKSVKVYKDIDKQMLTFEIDSDNASGELLLISPTGKNTPYKFEKNVFSLYPDDFIKYSIKSPFFYQYEITTSSDKVSGIFAINVPMVETIDGISCITINHEPVPVKGILDNYYYPDGLITSASVEQMDRLISEIMRYGFNAVSLSTRIEHPYYYYNALIKGLLIEQKLKYTDKSSFMKELEFMKSFESVFMIEIDNNEKKLKMEEVYKIAKDICKDKLIVVKETEGFFKKEKSYGDLNCFNELPKEETKPYIMSKLEFKDPSVTSLIEFRENEYIERAVSGMVGYFYSSLNGPRDGIFIPDYTRKNNGSKKLL